VITSEGGEMKPRVLLVGYGVVGKRVADAVHAQDDMTLGGVVDVAPTSLVAVAKERGFPVYSASVESTEKMRRAGIQVDGDMEAALRGADIIVDCSPEGITPKNVPTYKSAGKPFIVNGGEEHELTGFSFSSLANYRAALGVKQARVVSCNTTSLCRMMVALQSITGLSDVFVTIVRRGADPVRTSRGPINGIEPVLGGFSHHAPDVNSVIPDLKISSLAVKVSTTLSHVHMLRLEFSRGVDAQEIVAALRRTPRITLVSGEKGVTSNAHIHELYRDKLRPRGDFWEVAVWEDSILASGRVAVLTYCVHMECVAIPENVDAIRAMLLLEDRASVSVMKTDKAVGCFKTEADYERLDATAALK
jgi:glyceraldehyde-3-phosphate dehydrogenase (NAD(P))